MFMLLAIEADVLHCYCSCCWLIGLACSKWCYCDEGMVGQAVVLRYQVVLHGVGTMASCCAIAFHPLYSPVLHECHNATREEMPGLKC